MEDQEIKNEAAGDGGSGYSSDSEMSASDQVPQRRGKGLSDEQLEILEQKVAAQPQFYEGHVELINTLRARGDSEKLRAARKNMADVFPLSQEMWINWLQDEESELNNPTQQRSVEERQAQVNSLKALYERAIADYQMPRVWGMYCDVVAHQSEPPTPNEEIRATYERAIQAVGLDMSEEAGAIWADYRTWEANHSEEGLTAENRQQRVRDLYLRQLHIPHPSLSTLIDEYNAWETENKREPNSEIQRVVRTAMKEFEDRSKFEQFIALDDAEDAYNRQHGKYEHGKPSTAVLNHWKKYLQYEINAKQHKRAVALYERAVRECCLIPEIWNSYIKYLSDDLTETEESLKAAAAAAATNNKKQKRRKEANAEIANDTNQTSTETETTASSPDVVQKRQNLIGVCQRASRNVPWSGSVWLTLLHQLELSNADNEQIQDAYTRACSGGMTKASEYLELFIFYCTYMRRRVNLLDPASDMTAVEELRYAFESTIGYFQTYFPAKDPSCTLERFYANIEGLYFGNAPKARELYESIVSQHPADINHWMRYIHLERMLGSQPSVISGLFERAIKGVVGKKTAASVAADWIEFERECGTLQSYQYAKDKINAKTSEVSKESTTKGDKEKPTASKKQQEKKRGREAQDEQSSKQKSSKKQKVADKHTAKQKRAAPVDETGYSSDTEDEFEDDAAEAADDMDVDTERSKALQAQLEMLQKQLQEVVDEPIDATNSSGVEAPVEEQQQKQQQQKQQREKDKKEKKQKTKDDKQKEAKKAAATKPPLRGAGNEELTVFAWSLPFSLREDGLQELFKDCKVKDIRLIKTFKGQSKGYAYVEMEDEESYNKALTLDQSEVYGRTIRVTKSTSQDKRGKKPPAAGGDGATEATEEKATEATTEEGSEAAKKGASKKKPEPTESKDSNQKFEVSFSRSASARPMMPRVLKKASQAYSTSVVGPPKSNADFKNLFKK